MELKLTWYKPIQLKKGIRDDGIYHIDFDDLPETAGIYVFFRQHGESQEAIYVGKANNLKSRLKQQFNNLRLMKGIENSATGGKYLVFAEFKPGRGQQTEKSIVTIERNFIRQFLLENHNLINIQGVQMSKSSIISERQELKSFIPRAIYFED